MARSSRAFGTPTRQRNKLRKSGKAVSPEEFDDRDRRLRHNVAALGLYIVPTEPDGNCMFRAISDQVKGNDSYHRDIRRDICDYLQSRQDEYSAFIMGDYDSYLAQMRRNGEYGTQVELAAFSHMTKTNIHLFRPDTYYVMHCDVDAIENLHQSEKKRIYLAYHDHEHYSSIRNKNGPHTGPPSIQITPTDPGPFNLRPANAPPSSTEKAIMGSTGASLERIRQLMRQYKSDHNKVTNILLEDHSSAESNLESSQSPRSQTPDTSVLSTINQEDGSASDSSARKAQSPSRASAPRRSARQSRKAAPYTSRSPSPQDTIIVESTPSIRKSPPSQDPPKRITGREKKDAARKKKVLRRTELARAKAAAAKVKQSTPTSGTESPIYV